MTSPKPTTSATIGCTTPHHNTGLQRIPATTNRRQKTPVTHRLSRRQSAIHACPHNTPANISTTPEHQSTRPPLHPSINSLHKATMPQCEDRESIVFNSREDAKTRRKNTPQLKTENQIPSRQFIRENPCSSVAQNYPSSVAQNTPLIRGNTTRGSRSRGRRFHNLLLRHRIATKLPRHTPLTQYQNPITHRQ